MPPQSTKKFLVKIRSVKCRELLPKDDNGSSDPFVKFDFDSFKTFQTPVVNKNLNPDFTEFEELVFFYETKFFKKKFLKKKRLLVQVYDKDRFSNEFIGEVEIPLYTLCTGPIDYDLLLRDTGNPAGRVLFQLEMEEYCEVKVNIQNLILRDIPAQNSDGTGNYRVVYHYSGIPLHETFEKNRVSETLVLKKSKEPVWKNTPYCYFIATMKDMLSNQLLFTVEHNKKRKSFVTIGHAVVDIREILTQNTGQQVKHTCQLNQDGQKVGSLSAEFTFEEMPRYSNMAGGTLKDGEFFDCEPLLPFLPVPDEYIQGKKKVVGEPTMAVNTPISTTFGSLSIAAQAIAKMQGSTTGTPNVPPVSQQATVPNFRSLANMGIAANRLNGFRPTQPFATQPQYPANPTNTVASFNQPKILSQSNPQLMGFQRPTAFAQPQQMYQQPVAQPQPMYQQPVAQPQQMYQQPVVQPQPMYQQPVAQPQQMYQQPVAQPQQMYQQPVAQPVQFSQPAPVVQSQLAPGYNQPVPASATPQAQNQSPSFPQPVQTQPNPVPVSQPKQSQDPPPPPSYEESVQPKPPAKVEPPKPSPKKIGWGQPGFKVPTTTPPKGWGVVQQKSAIPKTSSWNAIASHAQAQTQKPPQNSWWGNSNTAKPPQKGAASNAWGQPGIAKVPQKGAVTNTWGQPAVAKVPQKGAVTNTWGQPASAKPVSSGPPILQQLQKNSNTPNNTNAWGTSKPSAVPPANQWGQKWGKS